MSRMQKAFDTASSGVEDAFSLWDKAQGVPATSEERTYDNLTPENFVDIVQKFGPDKTAKYIQTMEVQRMKRQ